MRHEIILSTASPEPFVEATCVHRRRFIVEIDSGGTFSHAFLPHTGRLSFLRPGTRLLLRKTIRKTSAPYDIVIAFDGRTPVVVDSRIPNALTEAALDGHWIKEFANYTSFTREVTVGSRRLDFVLKDGRDHYIEVKGCTLLSGTTALYPDAPTSRGLEHLKLLKVLAANKNDATVFFMVMRPDAKAFSINRDVDPDFGLEFDRAMAAGVRAYAYGSRYDSSKLRLLRRLPFV